MPRLLLLALAAALAACADAPSPEAPAEAIPLADGEIAAPADSGAVTPRLVLDATGAPLLTWVEPTAAGHALYLARWSDGGWSPGDIQAEGEGWMVNWADTPGVVPRSDGGIVAHTLVSNPDGGPYAYDVGIRLPNASTVRLNTDGVAAEHGFVSGIALDDGQAAFVWLDGRAQGQGHGHGAGAMALRVATFSAEGTRTDETVLDDRTCDCCPTAAVATAGGLVVAYRDRSADEIRDIAVVRHVDGAWTEPVIPHADGWHIAGCPVNGPALAASGARVALAWFAGGDATRVWLSVSDDAGATWGDRVRIDGGAPIGRVGVAMLADGSAAVSWLEGVGEAAEVRVRRVGADGALRPARTVATVDSGRSSGIPHIVPLGRQALVAWTDPSRATVRTAVVTP